MRIRRHWLVLALLAGFSVAARGQDAKDIVGQAV